MIHRYHRPYYQQVAVYFWPILFFELWRVDRWCAETGRWAVVELDRYGRAWVPFWEGMSQNYGVFGMDAYVYTSRDVEALRPGFLKTAMTSADTCAGRHPGTIRTRWTIGGICPWTPACAGAGGTLPFIDPG